jgi:proteasome activator subunit 4
MNHTLPNVSKLTITDMAVAEGPSIPDDIALSDDPSLQKLATYARSLPYSIESNSKMQGMLDFILLRLTQCVEAKDFDIGLPQWDGMLS